MLAAEDFIQQSYFDSTFRHYFRYYSSLSIFKLVIFGNRVNLKAVLRAFASQPFPPPDRAICDEHEAIDG
jgi:hypothetical protein